MLPGVTGKDDAAIVAAGEFKQFHHVIQTNRPGFIKDNHDPRGKFAACRQAAMQSLERHGIHAVLAKRVAAEAVGAQKSGLNHHGG